MPWAWGPCDGGQLLPDCPTGYQCGGTQPYSPELEAFLIDKHTGGEPIEYKGMCFELCKLGVNATHPLISGTK